MSVMNSGSGEKVGGGTWLSRKGTIRDEAAPAAARRSPSLE